SAARCPKRDQTARTHGAGSRSNRLRWRVLPALKFLRQTANSDGRPWWAGGDAGGTPGCPPNTALAHGPTTRHPRPSVLLADARSAPRPAGVPAAMRRLRDASEVLSLNVFLGLSWLGSARHLTRRMIAMHSDA